MVTTSNPNDSGTSDSPNVPSLAEVEVSFVLPCLNEAETLGGCIDEIQACIREHELSAEIVIADNGSTDGSQEIARTLGARVVDVPQRGYGSALMGGFDAAAGRYLIMGDADQSYDFRQAMPMIEALREGADMVMGSRFDGRIEPGAMPFLHKYLGNPVLSFLGRVLFRTPISDFHCGLRALSRQIYREMDLRTAGMEFATEMIAKAAARRLKIEQVPITLRPDGRSRPPHLQTWRDGWRHLRFMLTLSPRWTLFIPGSLLFSLGLLLMAVLGFGSFSLGIVTFDIHTMLVAGVFVLVGFQAMATGIAARVFAVEEEIGPPAPWMAKSLEIMNLERGLIASGLLIGLGLILVGGEAWSWASGGFSPLDIQVTLRPVVFGVVLLALGFQTLQLSFLCSMLGIKRTRNP